MRYPCAIRTPDTSPRDPPITSGREAAAPGPARIPGRVTVLAGALARRPVALVAALAALGLAHVAVVSIRYHVGSFDDDAAYLAMAEGIAHGVGLTGHLPSGYPLVKDYPLGYPALLAPLVLAFGPGPGFWAERLASVACYGALFPLTWIWLRRRGLGTGVCAAVLALLALNPLLATFGSMVMAEAPFLVSLLGLVFAAEAWGRSERAWVPSGVATVLLGVALVWLKEAGLAVDGGIVLWLAWNRRWGRALAASVTSVALLAPLVIARVLVHIPIAGLRYNGEIARNLGGGILHQVLLLPVGAAKFLFYALFDGVTPVFSPLSDHWAVLVVVGGIASATAAVFCVVGAVLWCRRYGGSDTVPWMLGLYVLESIVYPYVNMRRTILVVPVATAWYVLGARATTRWLVGVARRRGSACPERWRRRAAGAAAVGIALLAVQFPTDYKVYLGQGTSRPEGSPYMTLLAHLGPPRAVVETDYLWSTSLFSGHPGAKSAFDVTYHHCSPAAALAGLRRDHAAYGLTAAFNGNTVDDPCLARLAGTEPWAVELLHTAWDDATVFEVVGPGTPHPHLRGLLVARRGPPRHVWALPAGSTVRQVSVGATSGVTIRLLTPAGWRTVVRHGPAPWVLAELPGGLEASAVAVDSARALHDLAVVGSSRRG